MRLRLIVAYDGAAYSGWQLQDRPGAPPTVQGALEAALGRIAGLRPGAAPIRVFGAGRTDAGVHAHGQCAHCDVPDTLAALDWRHALNAVLPRDVRVLEAAPAAERFHARKDALSKTYAYQFWQERRFVPPQLRGRVWQCGPLDVEAMRAALPHLLGRHDFAALRNAGSHTHGSVRTVLRLTLDARPPVEFYPPHLPLLRLMVTADGFLKQMVRNMAGLLAACGRGTLAPEAVPALLAGLDRRAVPAMTAPAPGLALVRVDYGPEAV